MRGTKRVVFTFDPSREAGQSTTLSKGSNTVPPTGQNLVRITLMTDIPDQPIGRGLEHMVQSHRQFHNAQTGAQMSAGDRNGINRLCTQFICQLLELVSREITHILRNADGVEKSCLAAIAHGFARLGLAQSD